MRTMQASRMWWMGAVVMAMGTGAAACGETLSPSVATSIGVHDLDVVIPRARGPITGLIRSSRLAEETQTASAAQLRSSGEQALITDYGLVSGFNGDELWFRYWITAWATGYKVSPSFEVTREDGSRFLSGTDPGSSENLGIVPFALYRNERKEIRTHVFCGLRAALSAEFRAWIGAEFDPVKLSASTMRSTRTSTQQPGCAQPATSPPPREPEPSGSGGDDYSQGSGIKICYYEVWIDLDGVVVDVIPLGCHSLPTNNAV